MIAGVAIGLLPVLGFLGLLIYLDSYKLVPLPRVLRSVGVGAAAALAALAVNTALSGSLGMDREPYSRLPGPIVEELLKAAFVVWLIAAGRVGFLVDAAVHGFAVGTGFALAENAFYLRQAGDASVALWAVRGLGTAIMHGSVTAIFALAARRAADRRGRATAGTFVPGFAAAAAIHVVFNQFFLPPLATTLVQLTLLPVVVAATFARSERATRAWLGAGFDTDAEILDLILTGRIAGTRVGRYLDSLRTRFAPLVVADMLCMLRVHLELSIRAKGMLLARAAGLEIPPDANVRAGLEELRYLERSIGRTGRLAVLPLLGRSSRDLWQIHLLGGPGGGGGRARRRRGSTIPDGDILGGRPRGGS